MKRLILVYNPTSSRHQSVKKEVLPRLQNLPGYLVGKYAISRGGFDANAGRIAKLLKDGDLVVVAGGDGTASIATNAVIQSGKNVRLAALPYGNFNDLARTLKLKDFDDIFKVENSVANFYPLEIYINDKLWRYAPCYVTIGMVAEATELFDDQKVRAELQKDRSNKWLPYLHMAKWYFKNRKTKVFLPEFTLNGAPVIKNASDYAAVNGRSMARVMKGGEDYKKPKTFRSEVDRLTSFPRLTKMMTKSIFSHVPGRDTKTDVLEFKTPATVELQAEGEYQMLKNVHKIEIKKGNACLKTVHN